jgi:hypothetical protein
MIFRYIVKLGTPIFSMWIEFYLYSLSTNISSSKFSFGASEVEYLGHITGKDGVRVDPKKIEALQEWPFPKILKRLRGLLELTSYYHKFVKNYRKIAAPLIILLKLNSFKWTPIVDKSFYALNWLCARRRSWLFHISPRPLYWNVMLQEKELGKSSCKRVGRFPSPTNKL